MNEKAMQEFTRLIWLKLQNFAGNLKFQYVLVLLKKFQ